MTDVNELRALMLGLPNVDERYAFFYDETNNVRKLHLIDGVLNIERPECFVLGGVVRRHSDQAISLDRLRQTLRLQANVNEIKLKHLGSGGFLDLLKAERMATFLDWLTAEDFLIHYQATDILYWSIVDIVDSVIAGAGQTQLFAFHLPLKDSLYSLLRFDIEGTAVLLGRYGYPDVGERRPAFIRELLDLLEAREGLLDHFSHYMLKGLLQMGRDIESLPFLDGETPNVLIDEFGHFYLNRLSIFRNSVHVLDEEPVIETFLERAQLTDRGLPFRNHRFANSKSEPGVQLSDVVAGLLGKMFTYISQTSRDEIEDDLDTLSGQQRYCLDALARLLDRSTDECPVFAHYAISAEDQMRAGSILGVE
jgi:hypothetical protein